MKKRMIDLVVVCICLAIFGIASVYGEQVQYRDRILWLSGILATVFLVMAVREKGRSPERLGREKETLPSEKDLITEIALLSEEDTDLVAWNLYGKTAVLIGRDIKENQVDIDLGQSPYASMVDIEHAVLNFSSGHWYVEGLGSVNGLSVKKAGDGKNYRLSADTPCRLEKGDCLYIGMNRLLLR